MKQTRRSFVKTTGMALGATGLGLPAALASPRRAVASDRVRVAVIGCNGMGFSNLQSFLKQPDVECAGLCDVDQSVLERRAGEVEEMTGNRPPLYGDFRRMLDATDVDAVIIGTPDHWHCLMMVAACEAGKDVYVEKPLANTIQECEIMVRAAQKYGRIVQVGQWQRSGKHWADALAYVHSGRLGRIRLVKTWAYQDWMKPVPVLPDEPVPPGVDYDMWLGPAPERPFNRNRFHFTFRWFWDYAGGLMTDWGVHIIDMALAGMKATAPRSVVASGGKFAYPDDASETPDTLQAIYEFDRFSMLWEHATGIGLGPYQRTHGVAFIGNDGTLVVDREKWQIYPEAERGEDNLRTYKVPAMPVQQRSGGGGLDEHTRNFVDCIKSREQPVCNTAVGRLAAVNAHLGNVAFKTGRKVYWDEAATAFTNDSEANALTLARYRAPWKVPNI